MTHKIGITAPAFRIGLALALCAALPACGKYGPKGDRGLPPPPEDLAYPQMNEGPHAGGDRRLRSPAEQERIKSDVLARKRQR